MNQENIIKLLNDVRENKISIEAAYERLKDLPFKDLDFVKLDTHRNLRNNLGEVIYCKNKTKKQLEVICKELKSADRTPIIYSRVNAKKAEVLLSIDETLYYNKIAKMVYKMSKQKANPELILVITAGTSDIPIAEEAACTLETLGNKIERHFDVGVAGIHRLFAIYDRLKEASAIIAVAGMEGALPSVVAGLVSVPVIAVPTSIGYGANFNGIAPLLTMLNSCSPGVAVVNIDNGLGAGYLASMIVNKDSK